MQGQDFKQIERLKRRNWGNSIDRGENTQRKDRIQNGNKFFGKYVKLHKNLYKFINITLYLERETGKKKNKSFSAIQIGSLKREQL